MVTKLLNLVLLSILVGPLISSTIRLIFGRLLGYGAIIFNVIMSFITFGIVFSLHGTSSVIPFYLFGRLDWLFVQDKLSLTMASVVSSITALVHLLSFGLLDGDPHRPRFHGFVSLFSFFILILVMGGNLFVLFVGWEGVGLCSFLLIYLWWTRLQANKAAIKAIVVNRIGDWGLVLGFLAMWTDLSRSGVATLLSSVGFFDSNIWADQTTLIAALLLVGAIGKRAQLGLHTWLPDAMEGPTPVSALIHAATMVTAGVLLLCRVFPVFVNLVSIVSLVGAFTALLAATIGASQTDIKRIIALSTCSQLGLIICAVGLASPNIAIFHLVTHAAFKALLFIGAGAVIHAIIDDQDLRAMGGLVGLLPLTGAAIVVGSISIVAIPFIAGWLRKEAIFASALRTFRPIGSWSLIVLLVAATLTSFLTGRSILLALGSTLSGTKELVAHDPGLAMATPLVILSVGAVFVGLFIQGLLGYWSSDIEWAGFFVYSLPVIISLPFVFINLSLPEYLTTAFYRKWFVDRVLSTIVAYLVIIALQRRLDRGGWEFFGPKRIFNLAADLRGVSSVGLVMIVWITRVRVGLLFLLLSK